MRTVGGPWADTDLDSAADVVEIEGYPDMAYHRTRPTDTDWREQRGRDWSVPGCHRR